MNGAVSVYEPDGLKVMEILLRVLCDECSGNVDALFIHGSIGNSVIDTQLLLKAAKIWHEGGCGFVVINGITAGHCVARNIAYGGYEKWLKKLTGLGVPEKNILLIPASEHTASESENFLQMAIKRRWRKLMIEAAPHHQVRCFLQIVAIMKNLGTYPKVYNTTFHGVNWNMQVTRKVLTGETVLGQKDEEGSFLSLTAGELERIKRYAVPSKNYTANATIEEGLGYLRKRDEGAL